MTRTHTSIDTPIGELTLARAVGGAAGHNRCRSSCRATGSSGATAG